MSIDIPSLSFVMRQMMMIIIMIMRIITTLIILIMMAMQIRANIHNIKIGKYNRHRSLTNWRLTGAKWTRACLLGDCQIKCDPFKKRAKPTISAASISLESYPKLGPN